MKARFDAEGDVILITGGASGIGRALARAVVAAGGTAVVLDVDRQGLADLQSEDERIETWHLDVSDRQAVFAQVAQIEARLGHIDGLVCGAAIQPRQPIHAMTEADWRRVQGVNLDGVVWMYQAVVPGMMHRRRGSIIAFSSGLAHQGWAEASAYASTKGALIAFMKSAGKEMAPYRVRVNLIAPGVIDTAQYRAANAGADDAAWKASIGVGKPEDVVGPLMFLLSEAATMTASVLSRDFAYAAAERTDA